MTLIMPKKKPTASDRHKPRKMIAIPATMHARLAALAQRNNRPLVWEIRAILERELQANGL